MSAKQKVLILGGTGETGKIIIEGLEEDGNFEVSCLVRPSSAEKPAVQTLKDRGIKIVIGDLGGPKEDLVKAVKGYPTVISAIGPLQQLDQLALVEAVAAAGTCTRFVPGGWITVCPPGGIMSLKDDKELVYQRIWQHLIPYTIIEVGYWYQVSIPKVPSGKFDYALLFAHNEVFGQGDVKNLFTDLRDIGKLVARIIQDERTLNRRVSIWGDERTQNQLNEMVEKITGEKLQITKVSEDELLERRTKAKVAADKDPGDWWKAVMNLGEQYNYSKFIRGDNSVRTAKYLGYLDVQELYPDFVPRKFEDFIEELFAGKAGKIYDGLSFLGKQ